MAEEQLLRDRRPSLPRKRRWRGNMRLLSGCTARLPTWTVPLTRVNLQAGERIQAEAATMITMSDTVRMTTGTHGGMGLAPRRSLTGGSTFFLNTFIAEAEGEMSLAPHMPGDSEALELDNQGVMVQSRSLLAATQAV